MRKGFSEVKIIFSFPQNKLSEINKTYIDISSGHKSILLSCDWLRTEVSVANM
jgi:hypothetical protein